MERYNFKVVEEKWQKFWEKNNFFKTEIDKKKKKFYYDPKTFATFLQQL